ncbi:MAG TPA: F0F1 ATP synthase subunit B' [Crenalkalicoccus sp.]|jgi:F-type H+-transporting ATPase subunit b|nr:F0F1 ATP synthase subunit B' [Crenalkalicoccus sp.]
MRRLAILAALPSLLATAAAAQQQGEGMPQLRFNDPLMLAQIIWLLIIFGLLYVVMAQVALPRVAEVLEARRRRIDGDLEIAQQAKRSADRALEEHRAATTRARAEAQAAITAAAQQAQAEAARNAEALNARLNAQVEEAERRIAAARDAAMAALRQVSSDTTEALVQRLVGKPYRKAVERAVEAELAARGRG